MEDMGMFFLHYQCHCCWWPGDDKSQVISSHGVNSGIHGFSSRRVKIVSGSTSWLPSKSLNPIALSHATAIAACANYLDLGVTTYKCQNMKLVQVQLHSHWFDQPWICQASLQYHCREAWQIQDWSDSFILIGSRVVGCFQLHFFP